jgi:hypothetical protein
MSVVAMLQQLSYSLPFHHRLAIYSGPGADIVMESITPTENRYCRMIA